MTFRVLLVNGAFGCVAHARDHGIAVTDVTPVATLNRLRDDLAKKYDPPITLAVRWQS